MTIQTTHAGHLPTRGLALTFVGGALAIAVGYGAATVLLDEATLPAPTAPVVERQGPHPFVDGTLGNARHQKNTNWEERLLMHRR